MVSLKTDNNNPGSFHYGSKLTKKQFLLLITNNNQKKILA